ncbi:hypothetical protein DFH09DRAFT_1078654 [Mycena vulgaris]|nr:hypothetical protein DFH09DRAFT_1078654 [Mycena vulgaris]
MYQQFLVQASHRRLLNRLALTSLPLLAQSSLGQDFHERPPYASQRIGQHTRYISNSSCLFEPVLVGSVMSTSDDGAGWRTVELGLPALSDAAMEMFYRSQLACLSNVLAVDARWQNSSYTLEDIIPWTSFEASGVDGIPSGVYLRIPPSTVSTRCTPARAFLSGDCGSPSGSSDSSSTLSSTDITAIGNEFTVGDLLAVQCSLERRDFPRPSPPHLPVFVRVYNLVATRVEIVV